MIGLKTWQRWYNLDALDKIYTGAVEVDLSILYLAVLLIEAEDAKTSIFLHESCHSYDLQPLTLGIVKLLYLKGRFPEAVEGK